jgi:murein L,D-transpeptidase YafK
MAMRPDTLFSIVLASGSITLVAACGSAGKPGSYDARTIQLLPSAHEPADLAAVMLESTFVREQLQYARVRNARTAAQQRIRRQFDAQGIDYPAAELFIRVLKRPRVLEVWARPLGKSRFELLKTYPICALAGVSGPKRKQGDQQVPEGFYYVRAFNPSSDYLLSLQINYPNSRDVAANRTGQNLGGDIFIHGGCQSSGCLAITDAGIQDLYWLSVEARALGQERIPVHIFPTWLDDEEMRLMEFHYKREPQLIAFWKTLKPGYDYFDRKHRVPRTTTDAHGTYLVES